MASLDSFKAHRTLNVGAKTYSYYSLKEAEKNGLPGIAALPVSMKVLLENLLRFEDGRSVSKGDIEAIAAFLVNRGKAEREIAFRPARVLMQDFTGVPAVVDLAAMRDAMRALGTDPIKKLVAPRLVALIVTLPLLTVVADVVGIGGGGIAATTLYGLSINAFVTSVRDGITADDIMGGVIKPICFAVIIASVACYKGLTTEGGTVGVGRSTTRAVVTASIVVIVTDFFLARGLQYLLGMPNS